MTKEQRRILLVDDEDSIHDALRIILTEAGYSVGYAENGAIGFQMFLEGSWDAVITDRSMPHMTGEQLAEDIKAISPKTPIILKAQKGGEKAYALLHRALSDTGRIGIAKVAIKSREYLASVKPDGLFLILELMHFAQEVLEPEELKVAAGTELLPKELEMAKALIESMTGEWEPAKYEDRYQAALMGVIDEKIQKRPHTSKLPARRTDNVVDLVEVLRNSLKNAPKKKASASRTTTALVKQKRRAAA